MNEGSTSAACCGEQASHGELLGRLDGVLEQYQGKPGALIPVLQIAQGIFGFLPEAVLKRIAQAPDGVPGPARYFVLGDNLARSRDSRTFGLVKRPDILGRAWLVY